MLESREIKCFFHTYPFGGRRIWLSIYTHKSAHSRAGHAVSCFISFFFLLSMVSSPDPSCPYLLDPSSWLFELPVFYNNKELQASTWNTYIHHIKLCMMQHPRTLLLAILLPLFLHQRIRAHHSLDVSSQVSKLLYEFLC